MNRRVSFALIGLLCFVLPGRAQNAPTESTVASSVARASADRATHVLIISIDGLRPDCLLRADAPNIRKLMNVGSFSMWARTTDVAITLPSHTSMLTGVTPEKHGINFNGDPPDGAKILVPTLFDLAKAKGFSTGMAAGKRKFSLFSESGHMDHYWVPSEPACDDASTATHAVELIVEHKPQLMFVHFGATDGTGHGIGWGTPEQLQTIGIADTSVGRVLEAYRTIGELDHTLIIISADHGGTLRSHGRDDVHSRYIPWIAVGPGVRSDYDLTRQGKEFEVTTFDTFATACDALQLNIPEGIDGKPIKEIYLTDAELLQPAASPAATQPSQSPSTQPVNP